MWQYFDGLLLRHLLTRMAQKRSDLQGEGMVTDVNLHLPATFGWTETRNTIAALAGPQWPTWLRRSALWVSSLSATVRTFLVTL